MSLRRSLAAGLALLTTGILFGFPVPAQAVAVTVGTETTITAAIPSAVDLRIPASTAFDPAPGGAGSLSVEGAGRAVVAILRRQGATRPEEAHVVARFNGCGGPGCSPEEGSTPFHYSRPAEGQRKDPTGRPLLEIGDYRLTIVTDGAPATVKLRLPALSGGSVVASAGEPIDAGFTPIEETAALPVSPSYWSGGAKLALSSGDSVLLGFFQQDSPLGTVAGAAGACHFDGESPLLGHYGPGCPFDPGGGGQAQVGSVATEQLTLGSAERARMATFLPATAGSQQAGFWAARAGITTTPFAFLVWGRLS